ncbi:DMT family transporter [Thiospirochaeta perfilievii]|uniref:DMT family transporter n=1 Tax=Thiospirochaeta perfilievii TaxID=252967 RepID=A0A5C1QFP9_9SPIO|nr:DMT family transporter [Thiospirochaeta perfilievii]QEN05426.1 DMT family transporter [Thiospirochaeta perfilievii]
MNRDKTKNYILMLFAMIFWGASFVFIKIIYKYTGPITMIFSRLVIASILLGLIYLFNKKREVIDKKDFPIFFLMGFCEPFLYFIGEGYGMKYVSSTHASVIIATIPIFSMLAALVIYKEKVTKLNIFGVFISFIGIVLMIGSKILREEGSILGFMLMFFAVLSAVANSLLIFKLGGRYSSLTIITMQNLVGALLFLPLFIVLEANTITISIVNQEFILSILFLAIFPSVISFLLYISVLKKIGVTKTSSFTNLIPIITGVISFIFLGSRFSFREVMGISVVIIGLFMTQRVQKIPYEG